MVRESQWRLKVTHLNFWRMLLISEFERSANPWTVDYIITVAFIFVIAVTCQPFRDIPNLQLLTLYILSPFLHCLLYTVGDYTFICTSKGKKSNLATKIFLFKLGLRREQCYLLSSWFGLPFQSVPRVIHLMLVGDITWDHSL